MQRASGAPVNETDPSLIPITLQSSRGSVEMATSNAAYTPLSSDDLESQSPPLYYLKNRSDAEIAKLKALFKLDLNEMESKIQAHPWMYRWYKVKYNIARYVNVGFPFFAGPKSDVGIRESVHLFVPSVTVPENVAYGLGMAGACLSAGFYMMAINPEAVALRFTLHYATREPIQKRVGDYCHSVWHHPRKTLWDSAKYLFNSTALQTTNFMGSVTNFLGISSFLTSVHPALWWVGLAVFQGPGNEYYDGFSNDEFWDNLDFWWDKNRASLISLFPEEAALVLQVLIEGLSTVALRSVGAASTSEMVHKEFGFGMPFYAVVALTLYTYLQQFYPGSYDHYLGSRNETIKLIMEEESLDRSVAEVRFKECEVKATEGKRTGFAITEEPSCLAPLASRTYVGAYYGSNYGIAGALAGSVLMLGLGYRAEKTRITHNLGAQEYHMQRDGQIDLETVTLRCRDKAGNLIADTLTVSCGLSNMTTGIGLAKSLFVDQPAKLAAYLIMSIGATINGIHFGAPKTRASIGSLCGQPPAKVSQAQGTLFHRANTTPVPDLKEEPQKSSWFCWGRKG